MARRNYDHLRTHLSVFEAEYPIQNGYIARLLIVDGRSARDVLDEIRSIVQAGEPEKHLHEASFTTNVYALKRLITAKRNVLTAEWPSLISLFLQPFPLTFMKIPVVPAFLQPEHKPCLHMELSETSICDTNEHLVKLEKVAWVKDGEDALDGISLASELSDICDNVSSHSPSHNSHTCADVEENRTVVYNSHSSVCVGENVLSDRTPNHQVITSENIKEEMCYTEDVRSGEDKNKQTQKEATESVIDIDFQAVMAGVKDGHNENRKDLHQENKSILLEQGLSHCEKTPNCPQNDVNIVLCSRKYLNNLPVNKWKTNSVASQKSKQPSFEQSVQPTINFTVCPITSVLQTVKPTPVLHYDQSSVLQSDQPPVLQSGQPSVLQSDQQSVVQSYKCKFCHHGFLLKRSLKVHEQVQRGVLPYKCSNCALDTVLIKKVDKSAQYDDNFCIGSTFQRNIFLQNSRIRNIEKQSYKCDVCGRGFAANYFLKIHKESHTGEKPYKCDVCGQVCATNSLLKTHKIIHTGEKPYKCDVCGRCFALMRNLDRHKLTHTDEKPYHCYTCGLTFKQRTILTRHARTHDDDYPFKCDVCGHKCQSKSDLLLHTKTHTGEKPCLCEICGKSYLYQSALNVHKRIHTKERPYKCDICGTAFIQSAKLRTHKIIHTGEKPYMCDICGFRVNRKDNLRLHKKVHKA